MYLMKCPVSNKEILSLHNTQLYYYMRMFSLTALYDVNSKSSKQLIPKSNAVASKNGIPEEMDSRRMVWTLEFRTHRRLDFRQLDSR